MIIRIIIILAKRLSDNQIQDIVNNFRDGISLDEIAREFNCTQLTVSRNLKKNMDEEEYKSLIINNSSRSNNISRNNAKITDLQINDESKEQNSGAFS